MCDRKTCFMVRAVVIEYTGAVYHILTRGINNTRQFTYDFGNLASSGRGYEFKSVASHVSKIRDLPHMAMAAIIITHDLEPLAANDASDLRGYAALGCGAGLGGQ
jgi:hypothetical protein